jgi:hypothetical protein
MRIKAFFQSILLLSVAAVALPLHADDRVIPPAISKVWPVGMQRGTTATLSIDGRNLADIKDVVFDAPGITAKVSQVTDVVEEKPKKATFTTDAPVQRGKMQTAMIEVTAADNVAPGLHWFRLRTPLGTSNMMPFEVGSLPEVHAEGNMQAEATLPATLVGIIAKPGEVDRYEFDGRAGEEMVFQVSAAKLGSRLESLLVLRDESGQVLAEAGRNENAADAVLTYKLPQAGNFCHRPRGRRQRQPLLSRRCRSAALHYQRLSARCARRTTGYRRREWHEPGRYPRSKGRSAQVSRRLDDHAFDVKRQRRLVLEYGKACSR